MLKTKKILTVVHNDFEDLEFWYPLLRLMEEGVSVTIAGEEAGKTYIGKYGVPATSDITFETALDMEFDGLLVPGGWAPDKLRRFAPVLEITRRMDRENKAIGHICHAGWVLASANILRGRTVTSTPGIKDDMINAGATWVDEASVVDKNIVSARKPLDLPFYMADFIKVLKNQE